MREADVGSFAISRDEFERLVDSHHDDLVKLAFAMCGDAAMADDVAQASWQYAWRGRQDIRDPGRVRGWLFTIAANETRRQLRRRRLRQLLPSRIDPKAPPPGPDARFVDLEAALDRLAVRDRQLVTMRYGLGMTSDEIGGFLGLSGPGIRRRLQVVLARLREDLGDDAL